MAPAWRAMDDDTKSVRWMTYAELAEARGISVASATRMAFRRKWKRQPGNDGTARVAVPIGEEKRTHGTREADQDGKTDGIALAAVAALRAELEREHGRVDALQADLVTEKQARARAEGMAGAAVTRAERAEHERDELRADLDRAEERLRQAEIDRLVEAAARRSLFRRLWWGRGG
jgi:hypothetical protein